MERLKKHNIIKRITISLILVIINLGLFWLISSAYNIMDILDTRNHETEARIVFYAIVYIAVILNGMFIYHLPNWVDSWVKGQGKWHLEHTIAYYNNILDRDEAEPITLKGIYNENKSRIEGALKKALIGEKNLKKIGGKE
jgi:hypothetical protein